jgi:sugar lactone lactonase YvrE
MGGAIQGTDPGLTSSNAAVTTYAGSGTAGSTDATGTSASFYYPYSVTTDGTNLYVADTYNHKIRKIEISTGVVTTLAGSGLQGSTDAIGTAASFNLPRGITTDGTNLYVADKGNEKIRKIVISTGEVTTLAGSGATGSTDATGTAASFYSPTGITTDGTNLYIADAGNNKIRKIVISTAVVTTLAGSGVAGSTDATGTSASFNYPRGITTDGTNLYVADTWNNKIRKIEISTGVVTTLAGSGATGSTDATGTSASFNSPRGITTDGTNLYVADYNNHKIRKIVISTAVVTTLAGSGVAGSTDATGTSASFNYPEGITTDGTNLYVADRNNNKIRKISASASSTSPLTANNGTPLTIALEAMGTARNLNISGAGNNAISFTSNRSIISGDLITFTFTNVGASGDTVYLCETGNNTIMDSTGVTANSTNFSLRANRSVTAGRKMFLASNSSLAGGTNCNTSNVGDIALRFQPMTSAGMATVSLSITTSTGGALDSANAVNVANISRQYTTAYSNNTSTIDYLNAPANGSKFATNDAYTATGSGGSIVASSPDLSAQGAGLTVSALFSLQDTATWQGVRSVYVRGGANTTCNAAGSNLVANNSPSGTVNLAIPSGSFNGMSDANNMFSACAEVTGAVALNPRTISGAFDIGVSGTGANDPAMDSYRSLMMWLPNGYQGVIAHGTTYSGWPTYCVINNSSTSSANISVDILTAESGAALSGLSGLSLGSIPASAQKLIVFSGTSITPYTWSNGAETADTANAKTLTGLNSTLDRYSARINVATSPSTVTVKCYMGAGGTGTYVDIPVFTSGSDSSYLKY